MMPLLVRRSDLRPLAADDDALDQAIDAVEASLLNSHTGDRGHTVFAGLQLSNGDEIALQFVASAAGPASARIFPNRLDGVRRNAWLGIQISGSTGAIESMIASMTYTSCALRCRLPLAFAISPPSRPPPWRFSAVVCTPAVTPARSPG
jgi:alanine dehydrogenase